MYTDARDPDGHLNVKTRGTRGEFASGGALKAAWEAAVLVGSGTTGGWGLRDTLAPWRPGPKASGDDPYISGEFRVCSPFFCHSRDSPEAQAGHWPMKRL